MKKTEKIQYELLRPSEVKSILKKCPVVYIPVGVIEWHGVQNPLGTDGLKAHAVCCEAALQFGGVVLPTFYQGILGDARGGGPDGWDGFSLTSNNNKELEDNIFRIARGLVANDWKVIVGVTGHDPEVQRDAIHNGIQRACEGTKSKGFGVTEGENWEGGASMKYSMDHAGAWETSTMMYAHEESVNLNELKEQMDLTGRTDLEKMKMKQPEGIGGWNPLKYASKELGKDIIEFCAKRIGKKTIEILNGEIEPLKIADKIFINNPGPTD